MDDERRAYKQELARLGRAVREARERRGLSQRELADAIRGISLAGIRATEAGERELDYVRLMRLNTLARRRTIGDHCPCGKPQRRVMAREEDARHGDGLDDREASTWLRNSTTSCSIAAGGAALALSAIRRTRSS